MSSSLETIAPGFLIATPALQDPNFDHSVILMCVHNEEGAMGLVINKSAPFSLNEILMQMGIDTILSDAQTVMIGGPVAMETGLLLYETNPASETKEDELSVSNELRLCPNRTLLEKIGKGIGPQRYAMFLGHTGWGPGQLELEISQGCWLPGKIHLDLIFKTSIKERWKQALKAEGVNSAHLGSLRPQA